MSRTLILSQPVLWGRAEVALWGVLAPDTAACLCLPGHKTKSSPEIYQGACDPDKMSIMAVEVKNNFQKGQNDLQNTFPM